MASVLSPQLDTGELYLGVGASRNAPGGLMPEFDFTFLNIIKIDLVLFIFLGLQMYLLGT